MVVRIVCREAVKRIRTNDYNIDNVNDAAALILNDYNVTSAIPIVKIINDAGFNIFLQNLPKKIGGYIAMDGELEEKFGSDKIIVLNNSNNGFRRRFTLAHEFGHYLLDPDARKVSKYYNAFELDGDESDTEKLVNRFAAELLMPSEQFIKKYNYEKDHTQDYYEIAQNLSKHFQVPPTAVERRYGELNIL